MITRIVSSKIDFILASDQKGKEKKNLSINCAGGTDKVKLFNQISFKQKYNTGNNLL